VRSLLLLGLFVTIAYVRLPGFMPSVVFADSIDEQARAIEKQLQCPVCNGSTVADSPSDLAGQMRVVIRQKVAAGESRDAIIQYFVDRYGDSILMEPPRRGIGLAVWLAPVVILMIGLIILITVLRGWVRPRRASVTAPVAIEPIYTNGTIHAETQADRPASTLDRVQRELDQYRRDA
jgi:cytochrome c-type biogenesis protein CcmH